MAKSRRKYPKDLKYPHRPPIADNPRLIKDWNWDKNTAYDPHVLTCGSNLRVWWKCSVCGHEWPQKPNARDKGNGCPQCHRNNWSNINNAISIKKYGTLAEKRPDLVRYWDYERNGELTPDNVSVGYSKKVWWKCEMGHSYPQRVNVKVNKNHQCPECSKELHTSFPEQAIAFYFEKVTEVKCRYKMDGFELDVYLPQYSVAIEYDGVYFHSSKKAEDREFKKNSYCFEHGIHLIRVKESKKQCIEDGIIYVDYRRVIDYDWLIKQLSERVGISTIIDVDIKRDTVAITSRFLMIRKENSIAKLYPDLLAYWDYEGNGGISPDMVSSFSSRNYWWKCSKCGKSYQRQVGNEHLTHICRECSYEQATLSRKKTLVIKNGSLAQVKPELMKEWCFEQNVVSPEDVPAGELQEYWWHCSKCGFEWLSSPRYRSHGSGCPACSHQLTGYYKAHPEQKPDDWVPYMDRRVKQPERWSKHTLEEIQQAALKYYRPGEFKKAEYKLYDYAVRHKWTQYLKYKSPTEP